MSDRRLVYATDMSHLKKDEKKFAPIDPTKVTLKIRLETNGRGGKSVSVLFNFPENPDYWKDIAKKLKNHCGTGGTYKEEHIELQGDHREKMKIFLEKLGFSVKFAGGGKA
jgi:translation initiation factor 1